MGLLSDKARDKLAKSQFGLPGSRSYPMPDREHAAIAKTDVTKALAAGDVSAAQAQRIRAKANKILRGD